MQWRGELAAKAGGAAPAQHRQHGATPRAAHVAARGAACGKVCEARGGRRAEGRQQDCGGRELNQCSPCWRRARPTPPPPRRAHRSRNPGGSRPPSAPADRRSARALCRERGRPAQGAELEKAERRGLGRAAREAVLASGQQSWVRHPGWSRSMAMKSRERSAENAAGS